MLFSRTFTPSAVRSAGGAVARRMFASSSSLSSCSGAIATSTRVARVVTSASSSSSSSRTRQHSQFWSVVAAATASLSVAALSTAATLAEGAPPAADAAATNAPFDASTAADTTTTAPKKRRRRKKKVATQAAALPYPGKFESLGASANEVLQLDLFQGTRFEYNLAPVAPTQGKQFFMTHCVAMGMPPTQENPHGASYEFCTHVSLERTFLLARIGTTGRLQGRYHQEWTDALSSRVIFDLSPDIAQSQLVCDLDYKTSDSAMQVKFGSMYAASYLQSITDTIALGCETMYVPMQQRTALKLAAQHKTDDDAFTVSYVPGASVTASYAHAVDPVLTLATECAIDTVGHQSIAMFGYQYKMKNASVFKGNVDSAGKVAATLDQILHNILKFQLCGEVDHWNGRYAFGFGFQLG